MKTAGIIAEYNPFHNGHRYQIEQLRIRTGADYVIAAMSGDFVQRGEPAIYDKYTRTSMALNAGVDLVLELPAAFATSSAEDFAACGVALLDKTGVTDTLCFGSECGDTAPLETIARLLVEEPDAYLAILRRQLRSGASFPTAREAAVREWLDGQDAGSPFGVPGAAGSLLSSPNNILGIEYMKALLRRDSRIRPYTIQRNGRDYHDTTLGDDGSFASASAIRHAVRQGSSGCEIPEKILAQMPVAPGDTIAVFPDDLSVLLNCRLLELCHTGQDLSVFSDVSPELADRIRNQLLQFSAFTDRTMQLKTRQYTYTRISRALLHILLGITDSQIAGYRGSGYASYARILGFRRDAAPLLTQMKKHSSIPLITKTAAAADILSANALEMFQQDLYCSHIYQVLVQQKGGFLPYNEYTRSVIIL